MTPSRPTEEWAVWYQAQEGEVSRESKPMNRSRRRRVTTCSSYGVATTQVKVGRRFSHRAGVKPSRGLGSIASGCGGMSKCACFVWERIRRKLRRSETITLSQRSEHEKVEVR